MREDKLVVSGNLETTSGYDRGLFEVLLPAGSLRKVLSTDCQDPARWESLSLSPEGSRAIGTIMTNPGRVARLGLIDVARGTATYLPDDLWIGAWSPNGKWIAAFERRHNKVVLINAQDLSRQRVFPGGELSSVAWSPDSRYILLWKMYWFRCGFDFMEDSPLTWQTLDVVTGKRSVIRSSQCLAGGPGGWISRTIAK
jgi:hypothetical protein